MHEKSSATGRGLSAGSALFDESNGDLRAKHPFAVIAPTDPRRLYNKALPINLTLFILHSFGIFLNVGGKFAEKVLHTILLIAILSRSLLVN